jgi:hypothetical protein
MWNVKRKCGDGRLGRPDKRSESQQRPTLILYGILGGQNL